MEVRVQGIIFSLSSSCPSPKTATIFDWSRMTLHKASTIDTGFVLDPNSSSSLSPGSQSGPLPTPPLSLLPSSLRGDRRCPVSTQRGELTGSWVPAAAGAF